MSESTETKPSTDNVAVTSEQQPEAPAKRCTWCGATRLPEGACSFLECGNPLFDFHAEEANARARRMPAGGICALCPIKFAEGEGAFVIDLGDRPRAVHPACFWRSQSETWKNAWHVAHQLLAGAIVSNAGRITVTPKHMERALKAQCQFEVQHLEQGGTRLTMDLGPVIRLAGHLPKGVPH